MSQYKSNNRLEDDDSSCSLISVRNSIAAGYAAGISGTLVGHPFDSLKVLYQTQHQRQAISMKLQSTMPQASSSFSQPGMTTRGMHSIAATNNPTYFTYLRQLRSLYAGISAPLLTVGFVQSVNFAVYDSMRRLLYSLQQKQEDNNNNHKGYIGHDSMTNIAIASSTAGAILALFTSPMLIVKTAQQTVPGLGLSEAVQRTWRSGLFAGFGPHFFSETIGRAVYFCSYESIKRELVQRRIFDSDASPTLGERMISAAASGTLCWAFIFPVDAIRSRIYYAHAIQHGSNRSCWGMAEEMYRTGGVRSFYRGFVVTVIRAGPVAAAVLPMYDKASEFLNQHS